MPMPYVGALLFPVAVKGCRQREAEKRPKQSLQVKSKRRRNALISKSNCGFRRKEREQASKRASDEQKEERRDSKIR